MLQSAHQRSWTRHVTRAAVLCALAALSGCTDGSCSAFSSFCPISHSIGSSASARTYSLGATISGLDSSGLVLMVNAVAVSVAAGATTQGLASLLPSGTRYSVAVQTQPTGQTCTVASGTGMIRSANVANVVVTCSDQGYSLGGSIIGLNGSGLVLANGTDMLAVNSGATSFTMPTPVAYTSSYGITVQTQPAGVTCAVVTGTGTMPASAVTNVAIICTAQPFSLGGTITGLGSYTGLALTNGSDPLAVAAGSTAFTMPTPVAYGSPYAVAVHTAPTGLTCTASNASGTMPAGNVTNVVIACSDQSYTLGGTISGLTTSGLVLISGADTLAVSSGSSSFTMPTAVAYTSPYAVTVQTQPTGLTCSVSNGTGTMGSAAVTNIAVTCSANTYTVGGTVSGLSSSGLVLLDNGADATPLSANATQFTMNTGVAYGSAYAITVQTPPTGLVCPVSDGTGTVGAADVTSVSIACASNTTILYAFAGGSGDGAGPYHNLIQGSDGNFYGLTFQGGTSGLGTLFELTPSGAETVLYSLTGGSASYAGVLQGTDGNFYGTTYYGGGSGLGMVFKVTPSGSETVLYSFAGGSSDGANPYAALIQGSDGNFYGTSDAGGASGFGTVFELTPSGTETVLYSFAGGSSDGEYPEAGLIQDRDGNLYGTTYQGGASGLGTVFELTPSGTETVLYSFAGGSSDGAGPKAGVILGRDGNLYGTTLEGGSANVGTIFKVTPSGTETVLHAFAGGSSDGANPYDALTQGSDGNLYGATVAGGTSGYGTVFKVTLQ